jgi:hypothetical protein
MYCVNQEIRDGKDYRVSEKVGIHVRKTIDTDCQRPPDTLRFLREYMRLLERSLLTQSMQQKSKISFRNYQIPFSTIRAI